MRCLKPDSIPGPQFKTHTTSAKMGTVYKNVYPELEFNILFPSPLLQKQLGIDQTSLPQIWDQTEYHSIQGRAIRLVKYNYVSASLPANLNGTTNSWTSLVLIVKLSNAKLLGPTQILCDANWSPTCETHILSQYRAEQAAIMQGLHKCVIQQTVSPTDNYLWSLIPDQTLLQLPILHKKSRRGRIKDESKELMIGFPDIFLPDWITFNISKVATNSLPRLVIHIMQEFKSLYSVWPCIDIHRKYWVSYSSIYEGSKFQANMIWKYFQWYRRLWQYNNIWFEK